MYGINAGTIVIATINDAINAKAIVKANGINSSPTIPPTRQVVKIPPL